MRTPFDEISRKLILSRFQSLSTRSIPLEGIRYNAYADEACTKRLGWRLTLDANGHAYQGNLAAGTYWLKEDPSSLAGRPFEADATAHRAILKLIGNSPLGS